MTSSAGLIGGWTITSQSIEVGDKYKGIEVHSERGIIGKGATTHSFETFGGWYIFDVAHHSIPPGEGGQTTEGTTSTELASGGGSGQGGGTPS